MKCVRFSKQDFYWITSMTSANEFSSSQLKEGCITSTASNKRNTLIRAGSEWKEESLLLEVAGEYLVLLNLYSKSSTQTNQKTLVFIEHPPAMIVMKALIYQKWVSKQTEDVRKAENIKNSSSHFKRAYKNNVNVIGNEILYISCVRQGDVLQISLK